MREFNQAKDAVFVCKSLAALAVTALSHLID